MIQVNFKKWNRITVGDCSYVPSQPAAIPSSRSMLSRDKRLSLDTWNTSGITGRRLLVINFSTFGSSQNHHQGTHFCTTPRETGSVPQAIGTGTSFARDEGQKWGTISMPTFARRPSAMGFIIFGGYLL